MSDWIPVEQTDLETPTTEHIRNLFLAAYPNKAKAFDRWIEAFSTAEQKFGKVGGLLEASMIIERQASRASEEERSVKLSVASMLESRAKWEQHR